MAIKQDLKVAREIVLEFKQMLMLFMPYVPEWLKPTAADDWTVMFKVGKLLIWADVSLRRSGYGELIDYLLPMMLCDIRKEFSEELKPDFSEVGPQITIAIETFIDKIVVPISSLDGLSPS